MWVSFTDVVFCVLILLLCALDSKSLLFSSILPFGKLCLSACKKILVNIVFAVWVCVCLRKQLLCLLCVLSSLLSCSSCKCVCILVVCRCVLF